jgi:peroxiredoxin
MFLTEMNRKFFFIKSVFIFFVFLISTVFAFPSFAQGGYTAGSTAADFSLKNVDGKMLSLSDFTKAKGFIIIFTCDHCLYSIVYQQRIIDLDKKYKSSGYPVIAINSDDADVIYPKPSVQIINGSIASASFDSAGAARFDSYEYMIKQAKDEYYTFPYLFDETQSVAREYGATRTPEVFVLQKSNGVLKVRYTGAIDDNTDDANAVEHRYVEDAVDALLAGKTVAVAETKNIGCAIVWKK